MAVDLVVVGAGGFGRQTLDVIEAINQAGAAPQFTVLGVVDDGPSELNLARLQARGYPCLGSVADVLAGLPPAWFALGVGTPSIRQLLAERLEAGGWQPATLIHPSASIGSVPRIGEGVVICGGTQVSTLRNRN